jgi:phosphoribosyl 1,2-cyclic phosphate phosphodiesterase
MSMRVTILGCGSSAGVPRPGLGWGACDPNNPKNRRRRCALLVEKTGEAGTTRVMVDVGPDLREQLISADVHWLDGVFITHEHADHIHGIDDLRSLFILNKKRLDVYLDEPTSRTVFDRFDYCFKSPEGSHYPPIVNGHLIQPGQTVTINGPGGSLEILPFLQVHGDIPSLGYRFDDLAYSSDLSDLPDDSLRELAGLDIWIVDALRYKPHPSHFTLDEALAWIGRVKPRRAVLTNLHSDLDYEALKAKLPAHIEPAYDGMKIELA